jgi:uncharacterized 2Fe-2S/4Fe-4S cluster protein (DUF4445 family)
MHRQSEIQLFIDAGTNGEIVMGNNEWLIGCACSTGPAFEGIGISSGTMAAPGAIEALSIRTPEEAPNIKTLGDAPAIGICGSGMIDLMAALFRHRIIDRRGILNTATRCPRIEKRDGRTVYSVRKKGEDGAVRDLYFSDTDLKKLLRTKAAIQAAIRTLLSALEIEEGAIEKVIIAGRLGEAINVQNAVAIGMLPSLPAGRFDYLGNGSLWGANLLLLSQEKRNEVEKIANRMTYLDLSTHPAYMDEFIASLFIPHTDVY